MYIIERKQMIVNYTPVCMSRIAEELKEKAVAMGIPAPHGQDDEKARLPYERNELNIRKRCRTS